MTQSDNMKSEKLILRISFIMSTFFLLCEVVAAIWTNSQAVLIDCLYDLIEKELEKHNCKLDFLDIVKTGRRIWVDVYIVSPSNILELSSMKEVQENSMNTLNDQLEDDVFVELIPELKDIK